MRTRLTPLLLSLILTVPAVAAPNRRIVYQSAVLPNGLTVIMHEDRSIPVVAVNIWYKVGSKNEAPGKTGFAHLFEHYMFEGSEHAPGGQYFQRIFGMGGNTNATTSNDRTDYYAVVPSENLEEVLRLESDRMGWLQAVINQQSLDKQRAIVKNEKRLRENQPYGGAWEAINDAVWPQGHPYKWPVIGSMADLDAASLQDVKDFNLAYYRPNNAVIVLAGDIDPKDALDKVRKWFGPIPAGAAPPPLQVPPTPSLGGRVERTLQDPKAQLPMVIMAYPIPGQGQPGWVEMSVVASVLGGGRSSRLVQSLQRDARLVVGVDAEVVGLKEADIFIISAVPAPGATAAQVVSAVEAELAKIAREGITPRELDRVKAGLKTARLDALQRLTGIAAALAQGQGAFGDPGALDAQMEQTLRLKPEQARAAAERFLKPDNTAVITFTPAQGGRP